MGPMTAPGAHFARGVEPSRVAERPRQGCAKSCAKAVLAMPSRTNGARFWYNLTCQRKEQRADGNIGRIAQDSDAIIRWTRGPLTTAREPGAHRCQRSVVVISLLYSAMLQGRAEGIPGGVPRLRLRAYFNKKAVRRFRRPNLGERSTGNARRERRFGSWWTHSSTRLQKKARSKPTHTLRPCARAIRIHSRG